MKRTAFRNLRHTRVNLHKAAAAMSLLPLLLCVLLNVFSPESSLTATAAGTRTSSAAYRLNRTRRASATLDSAFSAIIAQCGLPSGSRILHVSTPDTSDGNEGISQNKTTATGARSSAEFSSIQAAVNAAAEGDIIAVEPGVYKESVDCHDKTVHIVGRSRTDCVIEYPTSNYFAPPLAMSAGSLWNMTVHGTAATVPAGTDGASAAKVSTEAAFTDPSDAASSTAASATVSVAVVPRAYCLHVDYDHLTGRSLTINNCTFLNDANCAVGIGLRGNSSVDFYNCSLCSLGGGEALYFHDYDTTAGGSAQGQRLSLRYCTLSAATTTTATISIHSQEINSFVADVLFENNRVYNNADGMILLLASSTGEWLDGTGYLGSSDFTLSPSSVGNNCALLNFGTYAAAYVKYATELKTGQSSAGLGELQKNYEQ